VWRSARAVGTPASSISSFANAFELSSRAGGWPEHRQRRGAEGIHDPGGERRFGANECEIRLLALGQFHQRRHVARRDIHAAPHAREPRIARSGNDLDARMTPRQRPGDGVFTAAAAHDQHLHF
jgi:hypothetical protein